jgi:hypothetical protein
MVLWIKRPDTATRTLLAYDGDMPMWAFLRDVIAPEFELECVDGTVRAKVHTPELRVVFNNEVKGLPLKSLVKDWSELVVTPWPKDAITARSLEGNARPG